MPHEEIRVELDLSDAIAVIERLKLVISTQQQQIAALKAVTNEVNEEVGKARLVLLLNHGHKAAYLDDGEMQCGDCRGEWDYKRPPLSNLTKMIIFRMNKEIAYLKGILNIAGEDPCWAELHIKQHHQIADLKEEAQELHDEYGKLWDENASLKAELKSLTEAYNNTELKATTDES